MQSGTVARTHTGMAWLDTRAPAGAHVCDATRKRRWLKKPFKFENMAMGELTNSDKIIWFT